MREFELYLSDLTPDAQRRYLDFYHVANVEDGNFDVFPIMVWTTDTLDDLLRDDAN